MDGGRNRISTTLWAALVALALTGCPPTGEPPPFEPAEDDARPSDALVDGVIPQADAERDAEPVPDLDPPPDATPDTMPDTGPPPGCVDRDGDGFVERDDCDLPPGDCAPDDPARAPGRAERCDGVDDDCDEAVDEGEPGAGEPCETDAPGICAPGTTACLDGAPTCVAEARPAPRERCDGLDDDCDGAVDEDDPGGGAACVVPEQIGACAVGVERCRDGALRCAPAAPPGPEVCNGLDDDCDGEADESAGPLGPGGGVDCETDLPGICGFGETFCAGGEGVLCRSRFAPVPERCNDLDDDCDGATDESFAAQLGTPCTIGAGRCAGEGVRVCSADGARVVCDASAGQGSPELCNGEDDDCDGDADEGYGLGAACTEGLGACAAEGVVVCVAGRAACDAVQGEPLGELCNGIDDDCDGATDEGYPVGLRCEDRSGQCVAVGTFVCGPDGGVQCAAPPVLPRDELCNGLDDDCDGLADEDFADLGGACAVGVGACRREGVAVCVADALGCSVAPGAPIGELCNGLDDDCDGRVDNRAPCAGPPTGVATLRIAEPDDPACRDLDGDGAPDNALGALAARFGPPLAASFADGRRILLVRMPGLDDGGPFRVELVDGHPDGPAPLLRAVTPEGRGRHAVRDVVRDGDGVSGGAQGTVRLMSPLFYDRAPGFEGPASLELLQPRVSGGPVQAVGAAGLAIEGLRLTGLVDRMAVQWAYDDAATACLSAGAAEPPGCDILRRITPVQLEALLVPDVDRDPTPGADALSACFVIDAAPLPDGATVPFGGGPCAADSDCFAGLSCRPMPTVPRPADGAMLIERCGVPGPGGGAVGDACGSDDDCADALCVAATARGGTCTALCAADADCPLAMACLGVARAVEGATTPGGASARVCVPVEGSGLACGADADCPADELCAIWLAGAGVAGGPVTAEGRCHALDPAGAPLGARCDTAHDCAHGNGCVPDLAGVLRCAPPCDGAGQCADGAICVERDVLPAVRQHPAVQHGFCLPVPPALGSGGRCAADIECPTGETCTPRVLATTGAVERYCGVGVGFSTIGQPCAAGADCASGLCADGLCSGLCADDADCGPRMGCVADALRDADDRVLGDLCRPATRGCGRDLDCGADPACADGRCVCADGRCLIGCRFPGPCPGDDRCHPDGLCAPYCRDDAAEPDDALADAAPLPVGPRARRAELRRTLCAGSPVDWHRLDAAGAAAQIRVVRQPEVGVDFAVDLFDAGGALIAGGQQFDPSEVRVALPAGRVGPAFARVRAAGLTDRAAYRLIVELADPGCVDPTEPPAGPPLSDRPAGGVELLAEPGPVAADAADGVLCPADVDYYPVWLDARDALTLDLAVPAPVGAGVELRLWGPDAPGQPGAAVRAALLDGDGGRAEYAAEPMNCPVGGGRCRAQGVATAIACASDADCRGAPYWIEIRGARPADGGGYRITASIDRLAPRACVPDPREPDDRSTTFERLAATLPAAAVTPLDGAPTPAADRDVPLPGARACRDAPDGTAGDRDLVPILARAGERLVADVQRTGGGGGLIIDFLEWTGADWTSLGATPVDGAGGRAGQALAADGRYAVAIRRPEGIDLARGYDLIVRRETSASDDRGCLDAAPLAPALGEPLALDTTTAGLAHSITPLDCPGGDGPDRIFAVTPPPGARHLRAEVEALADGVDPAVSIRADCAVDISELACNEDDPDAADPRSRAAVEVRLPAGGAPVYVVVDSFAPATAGDVRLTITASP